MPALLVVQQHELRADRVPHCDRLVAELLAAERSAAAPELCEWFRSSVSCSSAAIQCTLLERHGGSAQLARHRARHARLYSELLECAPGKITILASDPDRELVEAAQGMRAAIGGRWFCGADATSGEAGACRGRHAAFALAHLKFAPASWPWIESRARARLGTLPSAANPVLSRHWFVREGLRDAFVFEELPAPTFAQLEACAGAGLAADARTDERAAPATGDDRGIERRVRLYGNVPRELAAGERTLTDTVYCGSRIAGMR